MCLCLWEQACSSSRCRGQGADNQLAFWGGGDYSSSRQIKKHLRAAERRRGSPARNGNRNIRKGGARPPFSEFVLRKGREDVCEKINAGLCLRGNLFVFFVGNATQKMRHAAYMPSFSDYKPLPCGLYYIASNLNIFIGQGGKTMRRRRHYLS